MPDVSPSNPQMMLIPGSSFGMPFGPLDPPTLLIMRTASITWSAVLFRLFSATTRGSADSIPRARTLPSVHLDASVSSTCWDSSGWDAITAALALSTWRTSNPSDCSPSKRSSTVSGTGVGMGESGSDP